jgi:Na+-driven multidrug efflux pump
VDPRTRLLLDAPILPTLLRLAIPNVLTTLLQAATGLIEAYFIGKLGTEARHARHDDNRRHPG